MKRVLSAIIVILLVISAIPYASAAPHATVSGFCVNPLFKDSIGLVGTSTAPHYYGASSPVISAEANATNLRMGFKTRTASINVDYRVDFVMPTDENEVKAKVIEVISGLLELAFTHTGDPYEGDSLRYSYAMWSFDGNYSTNAGSTDLHLVVSPTYFTTAVQEAALDSAVNTLVDSFDFDQSDGARARLDTIYNYITENITYDNVNLEDDDYLLKFTAYAALINKTAVCEGYAVLLYRLALECGVDARVITGNGGGGTDSNHAWNIARVGDCYYYLDSTWDAGKYPDYNYYLCGSNDFLLHTNDPVFNTQEFYAQYPIADYNYDAQNGAEQQSGGFKYKITGSDAVITAYVGNETHVTVPSTIGGADVVSIQSHAFENNSTMKVLTISEGVESLGVDCIYYCSALEEINLPTTLLFESFPNTGFTSAPTACSNVKKVTVAAGEAKMKLVDGVLYSENMKTLLYCPPCGGTESVNIPVGVTEIGVSAFSSNDTLKKVVMSDTVKEIGFGAFSTCTELCDITLSQNLEVIGQYSFSHTCPDSLYIPAKTMEIRVGAFMDCKVGSITVDSGNTVYRMEDGALVDNDAVHKYVLSADGEFTMPGGIKKILTGAFSGSSHLKKITVASTVTDIASAAFRNCTALEHITLPSSVLSVGDSAFVGCNRLASIVVSNRETDMGDSLFHPYKHVTVYGVEGGVVQTFAVENGLTFKPLPQFVCVNGHDFEKKIVTDEYFYDIYNYTCKVCGCRSMDYTKSYGNLYGATGEISFTEAEYTGSPILPEILWVECDGKRLTKDVDYTVSSGNNVNVGRTSIVLDGIGDYVGKKGFEFFIVPASLSGAQVTVNDSGLTYNGRPVTPSVTVIWNGITVSQNDYTVEYADNNAAGTATVKVTGKNNLKDTVYQTFNIGAHVHSAPKWEWYSGEKCYTRCDGCTELRYQAHYFDGCEDTACNGCGAIRSVYHDWESGYTKDGTSHWKKCKNCSAVNDVTPHASEGTCVCGFVNPAPQPQPQPQPQPKPEPKPPVNTFTDVNESNYFYNSVLWAASSGVTAGITPTQFAPNNDCTRAQVVAFLWRAAGSPEPTRTAHPFVDVNQNAYYYNAMLWAVEKGITAGVDTTHFAPNNICTRAQIVTFLYRYAGSPATVSQNPFYDVNGTQYFYSAVMWAVRNNITAGMTPDSFAPSANCTRAQVVTFLYRYVNK